MNNYIFNGILWVPEQEKVEIRGRSKVVGVPTWLGNHGAREYQDWMREAFANMPPAIPNCRCELLWREATFERSQGEVEIDWKATNEMHAQEAVTDLLNQLGIDVQPD